MKSGFILVVMLSVLILAMAGCATMGAARHQYLMRGQVLEVSGSEAYICIGSAEGGKVGQEYTVIRFSKRPVVTPKQVPPVFNRQVVGEVKITEIVDEHYAKARVLQGDVRAYDVVELK